MGLNMYLSETNAQIKSMNEMCISIIQGMEKVRDSIHSFSFAFSLQGKTYASAKTYMTQIYLPLAQGIIHLCEELIRQNDNYPSDFRSLVSNGDVVEQEIVEQIQEIDRLKARMEDLSVDLPFLQVMTQVYEKMKYKLQQKLNDLYTYNSTSGNNYETAIQLAHQVAQGLMEIHGGKGFHSKNGTFSTEGMDLHWVTRLGEIHYKRKAHDKYGDYLREYPGDEEKIITIIKYEETHPKYVGQTNAFLSPLEAKDANEIKYLMYVAEEPYRSLAIRYLDKVKITDLEGTGSFFRSSDNTLTYIVASDRINPRGDYFTFFHELGHAIDYNYGEEVGDGFFSDYYTSNGKTLAVHMHQDVESKIKEALRNEMKNPKFEGADKQAMTNHITDVFMYKDPTDEHLTDDEESLYSLVQNNLSIELMPDEHNNASDVYGGVTINEIKGKWAHHDNGYWIDEQTGERMSEPNKEGFASYYASMMTQDSEVRDKELASHQKYLPNAKQHMDEMFNSMKMRLNK
jgi:hypothetical protein